MMGALVVMCYGGGGEAVWPLGGGMFGGDTAQVCPHQLMACVLLSLQS